MDNALRGELIVLMTLMLFQCPHQGTPDPWVREGGELRPCVALEATRSLAQREVRNPNRVILAQSTCGATCDASGQTVKTWPGWDDEVMIIMRCFHTPGSLH